MKEGFYSITYAGAGAGGDPGFGILVLDTGAVIGADVAGGRYDGTYVYNDKTEMIDAKLKLTVPAGVWLLTGVPAQDKEWSFEFEASFPRETSETPFRVDLPSGPVNVIIRFLRGFPD